MTAWLLIATIAAVLYGLWMLLDFVFQMIEHYQRGLSAADRRRGGGEQAEGKAD